MLNIVFISEYDVHICIGCSCRFPNLYKTAVSVW